MTPEEVEYLMSCGGNPLELSISKWADIVNGVGTDDGRDSCGLCIAASVLAKVSHFELFQGTIYFHSLCDFCLIEKVTGQRYCGGTPYEKWCDHITSVHNTEIYKAKEVLCDVCRELGLEELEFLKSLRGVVE